MNNANSVAVVINKAFGGFRLSRQAIDELHMAGIVNAHQLRWQYSHESRSDPRLVEVVERLGAQASAPKSELVVERVPTALMPFYRVDDYDGLESVVIDWRGAFVRFLNHTTAATYDADKANLLAILKNYGDVGDFKEALEEVEEEMKVEEEEEAEEEDYYNSGTSFARGWSSKPN
jgi:hypothetical protein